VKRDNKKIVKSPET